MNIDNKESDDHTEVGVMHSQGQIAAFVLNDTIGILSALVIDFDSLSSGEVSTLLSGSSHDSLFVVWWPLHHGPAEEEQLRHTMVEQGATLLERATPEETMEQCWQRFKERFMAQRRARIEAMKLTPVRQRTEAASEITEFKESRKRSAKQPVSRGESIAEISWAQRFPSQRQAPRKI